MLTIHFDEKAVEDQFLAELRKKLEQIEKRHTFWDMKELARQTCMSESSIKEKFFYDPMFPKRKLNGKWYFPAAECEAFLLEWIRDQPAN